MKRSTLSHSLVNIILVFIESALTLLLRLDPELRKAAYPLAKQGTVVCLRLYLPHTQIFATFSYKGILLDANLPADRQEPDIIINAYSIELIKAVATHNSHVVDKLQMRGESSQVQLVRAFITQIGLGGLIQGVIKRFKGADNKHNSTQSDEKDNNYKLRITEQQTQINTLTIKNRELEMTVKELHSKQKALLIAAVIATVFALIAIIAFFIG